MTHFEGIFDLDYDGDTGPPVTDDMVRSAEAALGVRLPPSYVELVRIRNGGALRLGRCATPFPTSWADDHIQVGAIFGVGPHSSGIDSVHGSRYLINEWGYPDIGVVIAMTPSGGHDVVMLDYRSGADEPSVAYVDDDRVPRTIAATFADFLASLSEIDDDEYDD